MGHKVNYKKSDLVDLIYKSLDMPKDKIKVILDVFLDSLIAIFTKEQSNVRLEIRNFGVFEVKKTKPKPKARNPKTNEIIFVPQRRKISFKPGKQISIKLKKEWHE